jgi:hypothetical protein
VADPDTPEARSRWERKDAISKALSFTRDRDPDGVPNATLQWLAGRRLVDRVYDLIAEAVAAEREAWQEYVDLLGDEIESLSGLAYVHGWKSSPERIERGKRLREKLGIRARGEGSG